MMSENVEMPMRQLAARKIFSSLADPGDDFLDAENLITLRQSVKIRAARTSTTS